MITVAAVLSLIAFANAQGAGVITAENHPSLNWQTCTSSGCTNVAGSVTLDSNWRWVHDSSGTNCYTGNTWSTTACPAGNGTACAANCYLDGADYTGTYGITASGSSLKLNFVTGSNVGSRVYLLASQTQYQMFDLLNKEFTFDVDVSTLPCGLNGALYFSQMDADGGMSRFPTNKAGAKYGTGYCDSQCPKDIKFINGVANIVNWTTSGTNTGTGNTGTCCNEMDIWEANSMDNAVTPHPCKTTQQTACTGSDCTGTTTTGLCDPAGCDFNPYRMGVTDFYGSGKTIDTTKPFTVVTQFLTSDGTDTGTLATIRRFYVQNGVTYAQPNANIAGVPASPDLSDSWCSAQKTAFSDTNIFASKGGMAQMGSALKSMVLVLSIWDDHAVNMLWLDSAYPTNLPTTQPGVVRGPCATSSGNPTTVEANGSNVYVTYSNIKFGTLGSTFKPPGSTSSTSSHSSSSSSSSSSSPSTSQHTTTSPTGTCAAHWSQCGGIGFTGPTCCVSGTTCNTVNPYYSQCL